jgi:hypothetical protein
VERFDAAGPQVHGFGEFFFCRLSTDHDNTRIFDNSHSLFFADTLQIRLENRYMNDIGNICKMSVDGTDFRIREPQPFNPKWYSKKFNGPGLRYEVGICIRTGWICWLNGPFPCGHWPDIWISRDYLVYLLDRDERLLSDGGYPGQYHMQPNPANRGHQSKG